MEGGQGKVWKEGFEVFHIHPGNALIIGRLMTVRFFIIFSLLVNSIIYIELYLTGIPRRGVCETCHMPVRTALTSAVRRMQPKALIIPTAQNNRQSFPNKQKTIVLQARKSNMFTVIYYRSASIKRDHYFFFL